MVASMVAIREWDALLLREQERAQPFEAVGGDATLRDKFGQGLFDARRKQARFAGEFPKEESAVASESFEDKGCVR